MRALVVVLLLSGCAPAFKCVAQEGYGELPAARTVEIAPLAFEGADDQREACQRAFREGALARMRVSWPRMTVVESGGDLVLAATLKNSGGALRVLQKETVVRATKFTTRAESTLLEVCRAFGSEIVEARTGCPVFL